MAAPQKYPTAHQQLLELAKLALHSGLTFEQFWTAAVRPGEPPVTWAVPAERRPLGCIVWPRDTFDRNCSIAATHASIDGWRRAYQGAAPSRQERALIVLSPILTRMEQMEAERRRGELAQAGSGGLIERAAVPSAA